MTFFLDQRKPQGQIKAQNPTIDIPSLAEGVGAGMTKSALETDANFIAARRTNEARASASWSAAERLGTEAIMERVGELGLPEGMVATLPSMIERKPPNMPPQIMALISEMADEARKQSPDEWADLDLSEDGAFKLANERMQQEHQEALDILDMMPNGRTIAEFFGGMVGITADVKNLPFLIMGGGSGSIARVAGREAGINMAAEGAFLPSQFKMSDRLEIPDPNIPAQLALAAAAGGVLGGGIEATRRGLIYWKGRGRVPVQNARQELEVVRMVDETEDILTSDAPQPFEKIQRMMEETPSENPINPERPPLLPTEPPEFQRITTTPLEPVDGGTREPLSNANLIETVRGAIDDAKATDSTAARPLTTHLRSNHRVTKKDIKAAEKAGRPVPTAGENMQVHPDGFVGQELKARGVTPQTAPGLFSRLFGRKDFDNLVAEEMEELFPGITEATGTPRGETYLNRDGFVDVLARDAQGDSTWLRSRQEAADLEGQLDDFEGRTARDDFEEMAPVEGRMFIDRDQYDMSETPEADIEAAVNGWMQTNGYADILTDVEKREVIGVLQERGGDPELLVERVLEREADFVEAPNVEPEATDIPFGEPVRENGQGPVRSEPVTEETTGGGAREGRGGTNDRQSEATDAGEQTLIDGVTPVTERQRLEAAQNAPLRGGNSATDGGLFDLGARTQTDMFSDVTAPEARSFQDAQIEDLRTDIEKDGDFMIDMNDGKGERNASTVLADIEQMDDFADIVDLCGRPRA